MHLSRLMKKSLLLVANTLAFLFLFAQQKLSSIEKFTVSGTIKSKLKGETLIGVSIRTGIYGTASNEYGFYSLTLDKGEYAVEFSAVGTQTKMETIVLDKNFTLNVFLDEE